MSRPGYVFDLTLDDQKRITEYVCRSCSASARGGGASNADLYLRMRTHLAQQHSLQNPDAWKVTVQQRSEDEGAACFWPPEAV